MPVKKLPHHEMASAGQDAGRSMLAAVAGKDDAVQVSIDAGAFRKLGELLIALSRSISRCGGEDCFARPVNGVRAWVPLEEHERHMRDRAALKHDNERLRLALMQIAQGPDGHPARILGRRERPLQSIARDALEG